MVEPFAGSSGMAVANEPISLRYHLCDALAGLLRRNVAMPGNLSTMDAKKGAATIVEFPIGWDECFDDTFAGRVLVLIKYRLVFLCALSTAQSHDPNQYEPIHDDSF
jgi:hypothetical protein